MKIKDGKQNNRDARMHPHSGVSSVLDNALAFQKVRSHLGAIQSVRVWLLGKATAGAPSATGKPWDWR